MPTARPFRTAPIIAAQLLRGQHPLDAGFQVDPGKEAAQQLQTAIRRELLTTELDGEIPLDHPPQPHYRQPHPWGLSCLWSSFSRAFPKTRHRPLFFDQIVESTKIICLLGLTNLQIAPMPMTIKEAKELRGGLSQPSKMPCPGYSLPATLCRSGMRLAKVKSRVCHGCYAMRGNYTFKNVQSTLAKRAASITHRDWVDAMVLLIASTGDRYFRWHDSGDIQSIEHLDRIVEIAEGLPEVRFWLPTREYKIVSEYVATHSIPANLVIRLSTHMVDQPPTKLGIQLGVNTSTVHSGNAVTGFACDARSRGNQCGDCGACWNPTVSNVFYPKH